MFIKFKTASKITLLFFLIFAAAAYPQQGKSAKTIKVACIGNSITFGSGIENKERDSYPAVLGRLLGDGYEVKNFGVSGRTLLKHGDFPYWKENAFLDALTFNPDIMIIMLGTNDSKPQNWKYKDEYEKDYCQLIDIFRNLSSNPKIYLCRLVPAFKINWGINDSVIVNDIIPLIEKIGKEENVDIIDLYTPFKNEGRVFPDGIHPNAEGAAMMAKEIYKAILK